MAGPFFRNRVQEQSTSTGTGAFQLLGAVTSYKTFVGAVGNGNTCYCMIEHTTTPEWELSTVTVNDATPDTLTRTAANVIDGSQGPGVLVSFTAGAKNCFIPPTEDALNNALPQQNNIDFAGFQAVRMALHNGTSLPASPAEAAPFVLSATGRRLLEVYSGAAWRSLFSFGTTTFYVNGTLGTDSPEKGTGTGTNAFRTIQYAVDQIPGSNAGSVTINVASGTYREQVTIRGKAYTGDYSITIEGEWQSLAGNMTATSGANGGGSGSAGFGTLTRTGSGWLTNEFQRDYVEVFAGTGSGQTRLIHSNTATVLTIVGRWDTVPDATSQFRINRLITIINGGDTDAEATRPYCVYVPAGQRAVTVRKIKATLAGTAAFQAETGGDLTLYYCQATNSPSNFFYKSFATGNLFDCSASGATVNGDLLVFDNAFLNEVNRCRFTSTVGYGVYNQGGNIALLAATYISGQSEGIFVDQLGKAVLFGYNEVAGCAANGVHVTGGSQVIQNTGTDQRLINNGGWGLASDGGGRCVGASTFTFSGNASGTYTPITDIAGGNT